MNIEDTEQIQPVVPDKKPSTKKLEATREIIEQLNSAGKWAKFLAILGFVFIGFMVIVGFTLSMLMRFLHAGPFQHLSFPGFLFGFVYLLVGIVYFFSHSLSVSILNKD